MFKQALTSIAQGIRDTRPIQVRGRVTQVSGTLIRAVVPGVEVGEICQLRNPSNAQSLLAEVVGFQQQEALLTPLGDLIGLSSATEVIPSGHPHQVQVSESMLGRVLDGLGNPLDGKPLHADGLMTVFREAPSPLSRRMIEEPLPMGLRALDGILTCGEGQRLGIFAAAGVGKSTLLAQLVRQTDAEIIVLGLIGERGREVREFIERDLGPEGLAKAVVVVATSDRPAMERSKAALVSTTIAEYFRDQGKRVLLLVDSITRLARAQREIGLAAGEPPTRRGYPPSVFAMLPKLLERAGQSDLGSITAFYTVLVEGDDMNEPIADEVRSILDGHLVLSRELAAAGHFPAIDILRSTSRVMTQITSHEHREQANRLRQWLSKLEEIDLLVKVGEYQSGADEKADQALAKRQQIEAFLRQSPDDKSEWSETLSDLKRLVN
jgi:type III secretion protein N (ATPase)